MKTKYNYELILDNIIYNSGLTYENCRKILLDEHIKAQYRTSMGGWHLEYEGIVESEKVYNSLFFMPDGKIKTLLIFPDYQRFMEHPEYFEGQKPDMHDDNQACQMWLEQVMGLSDNTIYSWGKAHQTNDRWSEKAMIEITFDANSFNDSCK